MAAMSTICENAVAQDVNSAIHGQIYRVTHHIGQNLLLTSKQKFRFGLARPGQPKMELLITQQEVLANVMGHPVRTWQMRGLIVQ